MPRAAQSSPVHWQTGSSDRGRDFAANHVEAIFAVPPTLARMKEYTADLDARIDTRFGRPAGGVKKIFGLQTVVGEPRAEAQEKFERIKSCIPLQGALAWISGHFDFKIVQFNYTSLTLVI